MNFLKTIYRRLRSRYPLFALIAFSIACIAGCIHLLCFVSADFADFFNIRVAGVVRLVLAKVTGLFPTSLGELAFFCLPFVLTGVIAFVVYNTKRERFRTLTRFFACAFAVISLFYSAFVFTLGMGYRGSPLEEKLGLERKELSSKELEETTLFLVERINEYTDQIQFIKDSSSVMPYTFEQMNEKLNKAYKSASEKYPFVMGYSSRIKPVMASQLMSKAGLLGMYSYYTGETNVNTDYMDYTLVFTCAHELSHQRGISREDDANFMAFLVCLESDDPYINYAGYVNMLEYMLNPLYTALKEENRLSRYSSILSKLDERVLCEIGVASKKTEENKGVISTVTNKVNDTYIKVQGVESGSKSYGLVVELTAAYYKKLNFENNG
ncbi:MAG: DUF3810 domain-containing protein [Clostridia bacterium]|nr:DUF3810 domain-containing protein [Clostridia bacterium]